MRKITLIFIKIISVSLFLLAISFFVIEYRASEVSLQECRIIEGIANRVEIGGADDIVFTIESGKTSYYINRGLEKELDPQDLKNDLIGKKITIYYSDHTNILSGKNPSRQIRILKLGEQMVYNEL
jgi:uncharacterized protein YpmB